MSALRVLGASIAALFVGVSACNSGCKTVEEKLKNPAKNDSTRTFFEGLIHEGAEAGRGIVSGVKKEVDQLRKEMR